MDESHRARLDTVLRAVLPNRAVSAPETHQHLIGIALSDAVSLLNPEVVVIGGELADAENHLFAGIRESVYARSLPLATRRLQIVPATQRDMAGVSGLVSAVTDQLYEPARVDALLAAGTTSATASR